MTLPTNLPYTHSRGIKHEYHQPIPVQTDKALLKQEAQPSASGEIVKTLCKVLKSPKLEYMHFDGNPVNYVSFMGNFEACLEGDKN